MSLHFFFHLIYTQKNPDIFYCPTATSKHQTSIDKMIVKWVYYHICKNPWEILFTVSLVYFTFRAHPINKLCEYEGNGVPKEGKHRHDCYEDVDETDFACKEKYRIMVSRLSGLTWKNRHKIASITKL